MSGGFSLCAAKSAAFPEYVESNGVRYGVNADFRVVLRIFKMLADDEVLTQHKYALLRRMFFKGDAPNAAEAVEAFAAFAAGGADTGDTRSARQSCERRFDFEFDAEEIYTSFQYDYGIDLFEVEFMHFYRFRLLLAGLSESSAFMRKISVRLMDLKGLSGAALAKAREAKERVRLPVRYSAAEKAEIEEFDRIWGI